MAICNDSSTGWLHASTCFCLWYYGLEIKEQNFIFCSNHRSTWTFVKYSISGAINCIIQFHMTSWHLLVHAQLVWTSYMHTLVICDRLDINGYMEKKVSTWKNWSIRINNTSETNHMCQVLGDEISKLLFLTRIDRVCFRQKLTKHGSHGWLMFQD